ncbi:hypothetical protein [Streptomyces sp. LaBMicrA B280]|uniref:hypothetical protein n=1 Tax=Streptomyces sp. LaBMicrA B280 TaxID=3391001 RepID=UPI003BA65AE3
MVTRWWEQVLRWEREAGRPRRLHRGAAGKAGTELERWRVTGRDAVVCSEVVAVTDA